MLSTFGIRPFCVLGVALTSVMAPGLQAGEDSIKAVVETPGLVAFWTFGEAGGEARSSTGTKFNHPLTEMHGPIERVEGGSFSGYSAEFNGKQYFRLPHAELKDLNISGEDAQVSLFAVVWVADVTVGARYAGGSMFSEAFRGRFAGLAMFDRALTDAEMKQLHEASKLPSPSLK